MRIYGWLLLSVTLLSCQSPQPFFTRTGYDFKTDPIKTFTEVRLQDVLASPASYLGQDISFVAMYNQEENAYLPFYTEFSPQLYYCFSVWPPDIKIWDKKEAKKQLLPTLFIARDLPDLSTILQLPRYSFIKIMATVSSDFGGRPWIKCLKIRDLKKAYTKKQIECLALANISLEEKRYPQAKLHLVELAKQSLPSVAEFFVSANLAKILEDEKMYQEALEHYKKAYKINPLPEIEMGILKVTEKLKEEEQKPEKIPKEQETQQMHKKIIELENQVKNLQRINKSLQKELETLIEEKKAHIKKAQQ